MFPAITLLQLGDYKLEQAQKNIIIPINKLFQNPFIDGVLLKDVALASSVTTNVKHKLARAYQGYFITKLNANSVVWVGATTEKDLYLKLNCSANCTVDIWVF